MIIAAENAENAAMAAADRRRGRKAVLAVGLGSMLENYDLSVYGFLAVIMARVFFPESDPSAALLATFVTFGVSFLTRPFGAVIIGEYADRVGRKKALSLSLSLMGIGSLMMALMPTHAQIGIWASVGVVVARLIQGFSAGGENATAPIFLAEQNPSRRAGFPSLILFFVFASKMLAAAVGAALAYAFTESEIGQWAWRIPFVLGTLIIPIAMYLRHRLPETKEFEAVREARAVAPRKSGAATIELFRSYKWRMLAILCMNAMGSTKFYLSLFLPTYAVTVLGLPLKEAFWPSLITGLVSAFVGPGFGFIADRVGRYWILLVSSVAVAVIYVPMFIWLQHQPTILTLTLIQVIGNIVGMPYSGANAGIEAEIFPPHLRSTATGLTMSMGRVLFGGVALIAFQGLLNLTHDPLSPAYIVSLSAAFSVAAAVGLRMAGLIR
jgi:MFS transporter, MHS family, proline/betaine transporter